LDQLKQLNSTLSRVRNILKLGTCSGNSPFQLTLIFVSLKLLMLWSVQLKCSCSCKMFCGSNVA